MGRGPTVQPHIMDDGPSVTHPDPKIVMCCTGAEAVAEGPMVDASNASADREAFITLRPCMFALQTMTTCGCARHKAEPNVCVDILCRGWPPCDLPVTLLYVRQQYGVYSYLSAG